MSEEYTVLLNAITVSAEWVSLSGEELHMGISNINWGDNKRNIILPKMEPWNYVKNLWIGKVNLQLKTK